MTWRKRSSAKRLPSARRLLVALAVVCLGAEAALADGCFVLPFVWNKEKDINEPTQKAIILYDAGREDLILQVKYEGPVSTFGWLVPVPDLPAVRKGSMQCFYELSRYTQEHMEPRRFSGAYYGGGAYGGGVGLPEPVKVIEAKTVGAYRVAVLSASNAGSLQQWLEQNHFAFPEDKADVLGWCLKRRWYFVAVRINLREGSASELPPPERGSPEGPDAKAQRKLAAGELHPLVISFRTKQCIFPLKISSANGTPSEVQVYVLSSEPLAEKSMFVRRLGESAYALYSSIHNWS